jgi:hypothetical protein
VEKQPGTVDLGADLMSVDYMEHRLPPHPPQLLDDAEMPDASARVRARAPGIAWIYPVSPEEDVLPDGGRLIKVICYCLYD